MDAQNFELVCDETQTYGAGSTRRWTARLPVPGGWLYRTELTLILPAGDPLVSSAEIAMATTFVPVADENVPRGTE